MIIKLFNWFYVIVYMLTVDIQHKETEEMNVTYPNIPTPAALPMSPGGFDDIMVQSPSKLDLINDLLQTEELTNISFIKSNEKDTPFTIQSQVLELIQPHNPQTNLYQASTYKPGSILFEPDISPIPQQMHPSQFCIPPSDKDVRWNIDHDIR